jgi:hypothetical protein
VSRSVDRNLARRDYSWLINFFSEPGCENAFIDSFAGTSDAICVQIPSEAETASFESLAGGGCWEFELYADQYCQDLLVQGTASYCTNPSGFVSFTVVGC